MKKKGIIIFVLLPIILILITPSIILAEDLDLNLDVLIKENEMINKDLFVGGNNIENKGVIVGDLVVLGNRITNKGIIKGDILNLTLESEIGGIVKGDIRSWTNNLNITGEVFKNVTVLTDNMTLSNNGAIDGSITFFGDRLEIKGLVGSDVRGIVNTLIISGEVKGDINIRAKHIIINKNAKVWGDLTYSGEKQEKIDTTRVQGKVQFINKINSMDKINIKKKIKVIRIVFSIISFIGITILTIILIMVFPKQINKIPQYFKNKPLKSLGVGVLILLGSPFAASMLLLTIIGVPIFMIALTVLTMTIYLAKIPIAIYVGETLFPKLNNRILKTLLGLIILTLAMLIPYLGNVLRILVITYGLGVYYYLFKDLFIELKEKEIL